MITTLKHTARASVGKWSCDAPYFRAAYSGQQVNVEGSPRYCVGDDEASELSSVPGQGSWFWDGSRLRVSSDRYGMLPLYYYTKNDEIGVSTSISTLIIRGAPREYDEAALAVFLRLGNFLNETTPFCALRLLPPNSELVWQAGKLSVQGQKPNPAPLDIGRQEAIECYLRLFRIAVQRCCEQGGRTALPLSGGRDSRHILAVLCELNAKPDFCVTVCNSIRERNNDPKIAQNVSRLAGVKWVVLEQPKHDLQTRLVHNRITQFSALGHAWICVLSEYLRDRAEVIFDGIGGDVLSAGHRLRTEHVALMEAGEFDRLAEGLLGPESHERQLRMLLAQDWYDRWNRDIAKEKLAEELAKHASAANPMGSFIFWNRTRRLIALSPFALLAVVPSVQCPYLDPDVFDFLAALPPQMFLDQTFHTEAIAHGYPHFAEIPYATKQPGQPFHAHFRRQSAGFVSLAVRHRASCMLRWSSVLPRLLYGMLSGAATGGSVAVLGTYLLQLEALVKSAQTTTDVVPLLDHELGCSRSSRAHSSAGYLPS